MIRPVRIRSSIGAVVLALVVLISASGGGRADGIRVASKLVTRLSEVFAKSGSKLSPIRTAAFGGDGHMPFGENETAIWVPIVDRFLSTNNLVARDRLLDAPPRPAQLRSR
ncbi:hypothetical protein ABIB82_003231 [Bradyrhizobium sp. i1.8.4]|uniref:hypothetical protein n=1 Tax=unclassified Bradyrhizobium TaxID=2631580 RepID=UPI003D205032